MKVLVLNGGSSNFKCWFGNVAGGTMPVEAPQPEWHAQVGPHEDLDAVLAKAPRGIDVAGHRIVHGGEAYRHTVRITAEVRAAIQRASEFAPAHNTAAIRGMEAVSRVLGPDVPQVAVF